MGIMTNILRYTFGAACILNLLLLRWDFLLYAILLLITNTFMKDED